MKRFTFKLESIKNIRESEEKRALDVYALSMRERNNYEMRVEQFKGELEAAQKQIIAHRELGTSAGGLMAEHNTMLAIREQIEHAESALETSLKK